MNEELLTAEERKSIDLWCYEQTQEDARRRRHGLEEHANDVMAKLSTSEVAESYGEHVAEDEVEPIDCITYYSFAV